MVYISVRGRIWLQAEAANMVESVGNYVKHRRVPVLIKDGSSYLTFFVPAISGESIAHSYQILLAEELERVNEDVCDLCKRGIFLKSTNKEVYKEVVKKEPPEAKVKKDIMSVAKEIEESIVKNCGVEDVGGFLYAGNPNVKRTSNFLTGYMIPVKEVLKILSIDPQLHSRYALGTKFVQASEGVAGQRKEAAGQTIYYVELSSALFGFSFDLDTKFIGKYTFHFDNYGNSIVDEKKIKNRIVASFEALKRFLIEFPVGAKRTRFNPLEIKWESIAIAVSNDIWTMPSSFTQDYIARGTSKKSSINYGTTIHAYAEDGCAADKCYSTAEEAIISAINDAKGRI
jgi:CRISPR-associated protein Csa2